MHSTLYNVELWRDHAAQLRALSWATTDPNTRKLMLATAAGFDTIAQLAGALIAASKQPFVLSLNWATEEAAPKRRRRA